MQSESRLQQECFVWFNNSFPNERGRLFLIHNNPRNEIDGAKLVGMGMIPGIPDMAYFAGYRRIIFLEFKLSKGGVQSEHQKWFQEICDIMQFEYCLVKGFQHFKSIIDECGRLPFPLPPMPLRKSQKKYLK